MQVIIVIYPFIYHNDATFKFVSGSAVNGKILLVIASLFEKVVEIETSWTVLYDFPITFYQEPDSVQSGYY